MQLARALYTEADVYLLDDPFSAVDAHTSAALMQQLLFHELRDRTVVLVTHAVEVPPPRRPRRTVTGACVRAEGFHFIPFISSGVV